MLSVLKTLLRVTSCLTIMVPAIAAATPSETVLYASRVEQMEVCLWVHC